MLARLGGRLPSAGAALAVGLALTVLLELANRWFGAPQWAILAELLPPALAGIRFLPRYLVGAPSLPAARPRRLLVLMLLCLHLLALFTMAWIVGVPVANYDVLSYHAPLAAGVASPDPAVSPLFSPATFYARMPLAGSLLEAPWLGVGLAASGTALHLFLVLVALATASSAARCAAWLGARRTGRLMASFLCLMHPMLTASLINAVMEPMVALMAVAGLELLLASASRRGRLATLAVAGVLGGTAMAIKFSAAGTALVPLGIVASLFALRWWPARRARLLAEPMLFAAGALLAMGPWFARGVALGGHPMFPFQGQDAAWRHEQARFVVDQHHPLSPISPRYWKNFATRTGSLGYQAGVAPVGLALLIAVWAAARRPRTAGPLLVAAMVGYAAWLMVAKNPDRFLIGSAMLLVPPVALMLGGNPADGRRRAGLVAAVLAVLAIQYPLLSNAVSSPAIYRTESRRALVEDEAVMRIFDTAADEAARGGRVLLFFEARAGLFPEGTVYNTVWDQVPWAALLRGAASEDEFARRLREAGYTAIFVNDAEWGRLLDFYATQWTEARQPLYGRFGILANLSPAEMLHLLRAFPPFRFSGFTDAELGVLRDFLLTQRLQSVVAAPVPGGYDCEVWYATIRVTGGGSAADTATGRAREGS